MFRHALLFAFCIDAIDAGMLWQTGNVRLPKQCSPGRRLGHGYTGSCSPLSDEQRALFFKTVRHRKYGLQDWGNLPITGKVLLVDCITYGCRPPPPPSPPMAPPPTAPAGRQLASGDVETRRQLGHGGASASVPAGWRPDMSLPPVSGTNAPGSGFCNIKQMVTPATIQVELTLAVFTYTWFITCMVLDRVSHPLRQFSELGFAGIIYLAPCVSLGCGPAVYTSIVAKLYDSNPVPLLPIALASQGNDPVAVTLPKIMTQAEDGPDDQFSFNFELLQSISDNVAGAPGPWPTTLYANLTDGYAKYYEHANSAGYLFLYRLYGTLHIVLIITSAYAIFKNVKNGKACSWATYVIFIEGIVGSGFRMFRCFTGLYFWNGEGSGTTIYFGN